MKKLNIKNFFKRTDKDSVVYKNILGAFFVRGGALLVSVFSTPAFIKYFNDDVVLGVWYTVLSVITWILNFDLGIGNGLRNHLTATLDKNDYRRSKELISTSYIIFGILIAVLGVLGYLLIGFVNWNAFFNVPIEKVSYDTMVLVVRCLFVGIMLQFFLKLINSVLYAMQHSAAINAISLVISVAQLIFVLIVRCGSAEESLRVLSFAHVFIITVPYAVVTFILFSGKCKNIRPSFSSFRKDSLKSVMSVGGIIFICQILYMIIINTNNYFISHFTGNSNVVEFEIFNKFFSLIGTFITLIMTPLWSMITKAISQKDYVWVTKLYKKVLFMVAITSVLEFMIIPFIKPLVYLWLGNVSVEINYLYLSLLAVWGTVFTLHNALSTFACGLSKMKTQLICYSVGVVVKLIFLHLVYQFTNHWIYVVLSNILILLPYCVAQMVVFKRQLNFSKKEN